VLGLPCWHKTSVLSLQICDTLTPDNSRGVFPIFQGGFVSPLRVVLYARVSTHDQQTLAMHIDAMREFALGAAGLSSTRERKLLRAPKITARSVENCSKRAATPARCDPGMEAGPLGALARGRDDNAPRTHRTRDRLRAVDGGA
jgi:hypothetical protein